MKKTLAEKLNELDFKVNIEVSSEKQCPDYIEQREQYFKELFKD